MNRYACTLIAVLCISGCATTRQLESVEPAGFLGDYSQLAAGGDGEARLLYIRPGTDFSAYDSVMLDSVTLWYASMSSPRLSPEDEQQLTDALYDALHRELDQDYVMVTKPGPGVLRVRAALTEAQGARVVANAVTSIVPQLRLLSTIKGMASDTTTLVGKAGAEAEITDSVTGTRLVAAVDARAGTKAISGGLGKWSGVKEAFDFWSVRLRERLKVLREQGT